MTEGGEIAEHWLEYSLVGGHRFRDMVMLATSHPDDGDMDLDFTVNMIEDHLGQDPEHVLFASGRGDRITGFLRKDVVAITGWTVYRQPENDAEREMLAHNQEIRELRQRADQVEREVTDG